MKNEEIREMSERQLRQILEENRQELFNLRFQLATRQLQNYGRIRDVRRSIARLMGIMSEQEAEA